MDSNHEVSTAQRNVSERIEELGQLHPGAEKRSEHYRMAMERAEALHSHFAKQLEERPANTKVGALLLRTQEFIARLNGLVQNIEIHQHPVLPPQEVVERVKQVAGRVVSPLVAEVLPLIEIKTEDPEP